MAFARLPKFAFPDVRLPVTEREVKVPTDVIFDCAAVVTVPAVNAYVAFATVPETLAPATVFAVPALAE